MLQRASLADVRPEVAAGDCSSCGRSFPAWALYLVNDAIVCGECIQEAARPAAAAAVEDASSWSSERGKLLKAERDRALDGSRWAIMPDSPLTEPCRAAFAGYLRALHRMTVDYDPQSWTWPDVPALQYEDQ